MSYRPRTREETDQLFQDLFEVFGKLERTSPHSQQGICIHPTANDTMCYGNEMVSPAGYQAFYELQKENCDDQINLSGQMPSFRPMPVQGREQSHSRYDISAYKGDQNLWVHQQMISPVGSQPLWDGHPQNPGLDLIQHGGMSTNGSEEYNLFQCPEITPSREDNYLGQVKTTSVDETICSGQKPSPTVGGCHSFQMPSLGNQTPLADGSSYTASSFGAKVQTLESFSVFPSGRGQLPQEKSHLDTQSHVTQKKSPTARFFCTYQGCGKSYTKSFHLKDHMKKHTGEKAYVCSEPGCQWKFYRSGDLLRHKRKHGGERLHPCAKCNKNFSRLCYLKRHQSVCSGAFSIPRT
ncbi:Kruppel-like factor 18 [Lemmus lemmus]